MSQPPLVQLRQIPVIGRISANGTNSTCISIDGTAFTTGSSIYGANNPASSSFKALTGRNIRFKSVIRSEFCIVAIGEDYKLYHYGCSYCPFSNFVSGEACQQLPDKEIPDKILAVDKHLLILSLKGNVYAYGDNSNFQLGSKVGRELSLVKDAPGIRLKAIATSYFHSLLLSEDGEVYGTGRNNELDCNFLGVIESNVYGGGITPVSHFTKLTTAPNIIAIAVGTKYSMLLDKKGIVYSCGLNYCGQLGFKRPYPQLGGFVPIVLEEKIDKIFCGNDSSFVIGVSGRLYACGSNYSGKLGIASDVASISKFTLVEPSQFNNEKIIEVATGTNHSLILTASGKLYSCGCNKEGQLGVGDIENRSSFTLVDLMSKDSY